MKNRIGDVVTVTNSKRHNLANKTYKYARLQLEDKTEVNVMFTDNELKAGIDRAKRNHEDCPKVGWLRNFID